MTATHGYANIRRRRIVQHRFWCQDCATIYRSPPRSALVHEYLYGHRVQFVGINVLTPRERAVLVLVAEGQTTKAIAVELGIGFKAAESHRGNMMRKLGVRNIAGVIGYAVQMGWIAA